VLHEATSMHLSVHARQMKKMKLAKFKNSQRLEKGSFFQALYKAIFWRKKNKDSWSSEKSQNAIKFIL